VIEEASVNELFFDNVFVAILGGEEILKIVGKLELVLSKVRKFFEVVVSGIWSG
jgi:hypothetical protein